MYSLGPGVRQAMVDHADEPRSDEQFWYVNAPEGKRISKAHGRDAIYYYYEEDNQVKRVPFE